MSTFTVLYSIEKAIKAYRKLCQNNITTVVPDITVDQALILMILEKNDKSQSEIGDLVFKDYASITRIVQLMINKNYLQKMTDENDKRKAKLKITDKGQDTIQKLKPIIRINRETALNSLLANEKEQLFTTLNKITQNCQI